MARDIREGPHNRSERAEEEIPEFMAIAREIVNAWGSEGKYLPQVIAEGLQKVYELGLQRSPIRPPAPTSTVLRRSRPATEPETPSNRIRRTRPV